MTPREPRVRDAFVDDARAILDIYAHYVSTTTITFEEAVPSESEMAARIRDVADAGLPWLVAELAGDVDGEVEEEAGGSIVGFAYASKWKTRSAYRFAVESTVYVAHENRARGVGTRLYVELIARLRASGYHTVIGGITQPNEASVRLHERMGFEKVALFREVGFKFERRLDVGYWQLRL